LEGKKKVKTNVKSSSQLQAARASWMVPIVTIVLMAIGNSVMQSSKSPLTAIIIGGTSIILLLSGAILGIIGCFGAKRHGVKTTIVPGLIGAVLSAAILAILISIAVPNFIKARNTSPQKKTDALRKLADQTNKQLPIMADSETRVDRVTVLGPDLLEYQYTFVNTEKNGFDVEKFLSAARPQILENYRKGDQFKMFRENSVSVRFSYYDKNGKLITNIDISTKDTSNK
jgi:hypothetical protein